VNDLEEQLREAQEELKTVYLTSKETSTVFAVASESLEKQLGQRTWELHDAREKAVGMERERRAAKEELEEREREWVAREEEVAAWKETTSGELKKVVGSLKAQQANRAALDLAQGWNALRRAALVKRVRKEYRTVRAQNTELEAQCVALALAKSRREGAMSSLVEERSHLRDTVGVNLSDKEKLQEELWWAWQAGRVRAVIGWSRLAKASGFRAWIDTLGRFSPWFVHARWPCRSLPVCCVPLSLVCLAPPFRCDADGETASDRSRPKLEELAPPLVRSQLRAWLPCFLQCVEQEASSDK